jgi:hypothetical protein
VKFLDSTICFSGGRESDESEVVKVWTMSAHRCSLTVSLSVLFANLDKASDQLTQQSSGTICEQRRQLDRWVETALGCGGRSSERATQVLRHCGSRVRSGYKRSMLVPWSWDRCGVPLMMSPDARPVRLSRHSAVCSWSIGLRFEIFAVS